MDFSSPVSALKTLLRRQRISDATRREIECLQSSLEKVKVEVQKPGHQPWTPGARAILAIHHLLLHRRWDVSAAALVLIECHFGIISTFPETMAHIFDIAHCHLEHHEPRLRHLLARVLGKASAHFGVTVYEQFQSQLLDSIEANFIRSSGFVEELAEKLLQQEVLEDEAQVVVRENGS